MAQPPFKSLPSGAGLPAVISYLNQVFTGLRLLLSGNLTFSEHIASEIVKGEARDNGAGRIIIGKECRKSGKPEGLILIKGQSRLVGWEKQGKYLVAELEQEGPCSLLIIYS